MSITAWMDRTFYPDVADKWDAIDFREQVLLYLDQWKGRAISTGHGRDNGGTRMLDLGAGAGTLKQMDFREHGVSVFGCDIDFGIRSNQYIDHAVICDAALLPYRDETFDLIVSCNVLEHIQHPNAVFREIARVLKPDGIFLAKTPNRHHYVTLTARLTPFWFHRWINKLRGRQESDTFPTYYRANTESKLRSLASSAGLIILSMSSTERRPEYCRLNPVLYAFGILYAKIVNHSPMFESLRVNLIAAVGKART